MSDKAKEAKLLDWAIILPAIGNSLLKLSPRQQWKNPVMFVALLIAVVLIVGALSFVPALALGPIVEHLMMNGGLT